MNKFIFIGFKMRVQQNICNTIENAKSIVVKIICIKKNHFKKDSHYLMGTGFYFKENYILTNYHVINGFDEIKIGFYNDENLFDVEIVGFDIYLDICVLKSSKWVNNLLKCNSNDLKEGLVVICVGMPQGLDFTSTIGIISSLNHGIRLDNGEVIDEVIQLNTFLTDGNSGGPLLNINSEIIGINCLSLFNRDKISFALKINFVIKIAEKIIN